MEGRKAGKAWRQRRGLCKLEQSLKKHSTQHNTGQRNFNPKMLYFDKGKAKNWCIDSAAVSIFVVIMVELTNTVFVNLTNITTNIETAALSMPLSKILLQFLLKCAGMAWHGMVWHGRA